MNILDLNDKSKITVENFKNSDIFYIDNFYKNPDMVVDFLEKQPSGFHDPGHDPDHENLNGKYFHDLRHEVCLKDMENVTVYLSKLCNRNFLFHERNRVKTNKTKFKLCKFNDYKNNFWHPHQDDGYTAIIYLNKNDEECGTNLYEIISPDLDDSFGEHVTPWRDKSKWSIIKTITPKYNSCVIFDALKFYHGMNICNDKYFGDEYRLNQVVFMK
tara:strand:- start:275 stop:919 length:645 start_codon:yes stop_codon:yes gene_type:complete